MSYFLTYISTLWYSLKNKDDDVQKFVSVLGNMALLIEHTCVYQG